MQAMGSRGAFGLVVVLALGGCAKEEPRMPAACLGGDDAVVRALDGAPRSATFEDGTLLSECVRRARSDAELQNLGLTLSRVADRLAAGARDGDDAAAARLGFMAAAVRRGAARSNGITLELAHRIDSAARGLEASTPALRRALEQGLDAGRVRG
jgi:hypothetical protein